MIDKRVVNIHISKAPHSVWMEKDPIIEMATPIYDSTNKAIKVGDGVRHYSELPYANEEYLKEFVETYVAQEMHNYTLLEDAGNKIEASVGGQQGKTVTINLINKLGEVIDSAEFTLDELVTSADLSIVSERLNLHINRKDNPHEVTKTQIGLGNVDNTADIDKPVSNPTKEYVAQFGGKIDSISVNHEEQTIDENKNVDITVPTKLSDLDNDLGFVDNDYVDASDGALSDRIDENANEITKKVNISDIQDNLTSDAEDKPLSAKQGQILWGKIENLQNRGRFLSLWNCTTGLAESEPTTPTYTYKIGDYFIVGTVASEEGQTNYKPNGTIYDKTVPSTTVETQAVESGDVYYYDGTVWMLQRNTQQDVAFVNIAGSPFDNTALANVLNGKQDRLGAVEAMGGDNAGLDLDKNVTIYGHSVYFGTGSNPKTNVTPTNGVDITNKEYVDNHHDDTKQDNLTDKQMAAVDCGISEHSWNEVYLGFDNKQDKLTAGENVVIDQNNVISVIKDEGFKLIRTIDLDDDVLGISISADDNGNSFEINDLLFIASPFAANSSQVSTSWVQLHIYPEVNASAAKRVPIWRFEALGRSNNHYLLRLKRFGNHWYALSSYGSTNSQQFYQNVFCTNGNPVLQADFNAKKLYIECSNNGVGAGTHIEVWGVKV